MSDEALPVAPLDPASVGAFDAYRSRHHAARVALVALDRQGARLANLRALTFLVAAAAALGAYFRWVDGWAWALAAAAFAGYATLARRHDRVMDEEARAGARVELNRRGLLRLSGGWRGFPSRGADHLDPDHPYAADLDVFGQGSLFQLLDETATRPGEVLLARWLRRPSRTAEAISRQGAVRELAPLVDFRQSLSAEARLAAKQKADPAGFTEWAEGTDLLRPLRWARPLGYALPPLTLLLYLGGRAGLLWGGAFLLGLAAQLLLVVATRRTLGRYYERILMGEAGFVRFERTFLALESHAFEHPTLRAIRSGLAAEGAPPVSARLARFSALFSFAELRQSGQLHAVVNWLTLWDLHWLFQLEGWRRAHGAEVRRWFEALATAEALSSLAGFAFDRPGWAFPSFVEAGPLFEAAALGHPLLDAPVRNDVALRAPGEVMVLTGSNMSGKTTLLRAMGLNAVLALTGLPVCAKALRLSELEVLTSMRLKDSLERGVSYFYAEVQRMKSLLDHAQAHPGQALFLLDEMFLGTNARERHIASRGLLRLLGGTGGIGAITTHDPALTELESGPSLTVHNFHFRDQVEDGRMTFDYRLREGVANSTNALRVLQAAGIPLET